MTTEPIKLSAADILQLQANVAVAAEANAVPVADRAALCCAVDHPLSWAAANGEQFTITKPEVKDGGVFMWVTVERDGAVIHCDDHYLFGLSDFYSFPDAGRNWVFALREIIESVVLK